MRILLAPAEGLPGRSLRDALTRVGGVCRCVSAVHPQEHCPNGGGELKIRNARHRDDERPLGVTCSSHACMSVRSPEGQVSGGFSRVYRHHLERCDEMSAPMLASIHRLHYDINLMREFRGALDQGRYAAWRTGLHADRVRGVG